MVQEAGVGSRHRMPVCSSEWETNSLAGKTIDLQSLALQWQQTYALSDWSRVKRSAGIQGSSHPGGLRNMAVRIACMGVDVWNLKDSNSIPGSWLYGNWKTEFSYWNVCRITYRPIRTKS
jgi:hypothetical protein